MHIKESVLNRNVSDNMQTSGNLPSNKNNAVLKEQPTALNCNDELLLSLDSQIETALSELPEQKELNSRIISKRMVKDGAINTIYKNGLKEVVDPKTNAGTITLPNGIEIEMLAADENGLPQQINIKKDGHMYEEMVDFEIDYDHFDNKLYKITLRGVPGYDSLTLSGKNNSQIFSDKRDYKDQQKEDYQNYLKKIEKGTIPKMQWYNYELTDKKKSELYSSEGGIYTSVNDTDTCVYDGSLAGDGKLQVWSPISMADYKVEKEYNPDKDSTTYKITPPDSNPQNIQTFKRDISDNAIKSIDF